ncbi:protein of unknown function DUF927 [Rhodomicrobium vannielii ATCC 17100]|uniref:Uncharacterized protein n=1 Tax=Rhodomicrobium vannielii (strain ATCC 17100 / DSM 162 / LMG 4299 / NCIMB 10020 / ATH 3.1.1) TaxID=648757 RepID=E3I5H8_RHOVT|nr:DUF927 domain-containing protein [Rhodomicrobium vannielii]ADP71699.1 protein of unknown function DUF927 [Rhodomicrobium vannielii ATCC 17100]
MPPASAIEFGASSPDFQRTLLPHGFRYAADGDIERIVGVEKDGGKVWGRLCSPLEFVARTENASGTAPGLLIRIQTQNGNWNELSIPLSGLIGDELLRDLLDHGLRFVPVGRDATELKRLLVSVVCEKRARCVSHVGWYGDVFVLPDAIIGQSPGVRIVFQPTHTMEHAYRVGGTFGGWKREVAARVAGNSRLMFALSAAFVGPLLKLAQMDGGGFHFRGPSSTGKSTALHVAGSAWGGGGVSDFVCSWRATDNALEGLALIHNDTLLTLDEIAEVDPKAAFRAAYMLSNGKGKARFDKAARLRPGYEWRSSFLSTGEISLSAKIGEDGRIATAGQAVRVIDIPADAGCGMGLFEELHGFNRPGDLAVALRGATKRHYGHAARAFIAEIVKDVPGIASATRDAIATMVGQICPKECDGQVRRVASRFALAAHAGELATSFGVVPWSPGDAFAASRRCFEDWLRSRGGSGQKEIEDALDAVFGFLTRYASRFRPWEAPDHQIFDCAGYVRDTREGRAFYVFKSTFQNEICGRGGIDPDYAAETLARQGYLKRSSDGKRTRTERLPKIGNQRVYVIRISSGEDGDERAAAVSPEPR